MSKRFLRKIDLLSSPASQMLEKGNQPNRIVSVNFVLHKVS